MALCKLEGEIIISTATVLATMNDGGGADTITIPAGRYFLNTVGSGGATRTLLAEIAFQMETAMGAGSSSVTVDDNSDTSVGKVTISRSSAFSVTWSSTSLRDALGFTGNLGSASSHLSTNHAKYLFLPNCGRSGVLGPDASDGAIEADYTLSIGTDGTAYALSYSKRYRDSLEFRTLKGSKTWTAMDVTTNEAYQQFYEDVISLGLRVRYHADRSSDATFRTWVVEDGGSFAPVAVREEWTESTESLWAIRHLVRKTS